MAYLDGRAYTDNRIEADDYGIVLRHGELDYDGYGIREPVVFEHEGKYFLHYDGSDEQTGWSCYLAVSDDLINWTKVGRIIEPAQTPDDINYEFDRSGAVYNYPYFEDGVWHGFYIGSNFDRKKASDILEMPYITLKATATSPYGPWVKQKILPFYMSPGTYYEATASSGAIVKHGDEYLQFFSASVCNEKGVQRTLSLARTWDLNSEWTVDAEPLFPLSEQIENVGIFYEEETKTWFLFTNHIGINERFEYADSVWMYWSKDLTSWDINNKAVVLDGKNCTWSKEIIGAPTVIRKGGHLHIFYDGLSDDSMSNYHRHIGMATLKLPIEIPGQR